MKSISASIIFILIIQFGFGQGQTIKFLDNNMSPQASLDEVSWIQGYWKGEAFGGITEEFWSPPLGDSMMFSFKLVVDNKVIFYELGGIRQLDETLLLQLKHFGNDFKGWEEKDETVNFVGWSGIRLKTEYNMNSFTKYYDADYRTILG